jgi:hypothetical protein
LQKKESYTGQNLNIGGIKNSGAQPAYAKVHKIDDRAMVEYAVDQVPGAASNHE